MSSSPQLVQDSLEQENRMELERVLASSYFRRAPALSKFLCYICETCFKGLDHEIKEYNIAVSALGRRAGFDPQVDPIVRVSAHSLRKRLESYYQGEGCLNPIHIILPVGSYVPVFQRLNDIRPAQYHPASQPVLAVAHNSPSSTGRSEGTQETPLVTSNAISSLPETSLPAKRLKRPLVLGALLVLVAVSTFVIIRRYHAIADPAPAAPQGGVTAPLLALRLGSGQQWVDHAGQLWSPDSFCHGGSRHENDVKRISGVSDPEIMAGELAGDFHCALPVNPGSYELHLFFVDLSGAPVAAHRPSLLVNGRQYRYDIICDSEGTGRAAIKVLIDVKPGADGLIHVDAGDDQAFLSAIEIFRGVPGKMLPLRISASAISYVDSQGVSWLSDRYFGGGTQLQRALAAVGTDRPRLYQWERYGRFSYYLPVVDGKTYTIRLHFSEGYFGRDKLVSGGPGSRIFDVYANGRTLLKNFDILSEASPGHDSVVKVFSGIEPLNDGVIEVEFQPVHDYALVNAVEITQE
jgi:hypothetical protein